MTTTTIIIILNKMYLYLFYTLFIFLAIILLLFYNFSFSKDVDKYRIKTILADDLQTGDIFLTDYQNVNNFIITSLFKENFMHPSIVLKEGNEIYVLDYIADKGIIKKPLNSWHKFNSINGCIVGLNKLKCSDEKREIVERNLKELYENYKPKLEGPPGFDLSWRRFWWPAKKYHTNFDISKMVCLELNVHLLIESGVIAKNRSIESYLPRDFENMNGFTTLPGFKFKEFNLINTIIF